MHPSPSQVIIDGDEDENQDKKAAGLIIEKKADEKQISVTKKYFVLDQTEQSKHDGKEHPKMKLREQQRAALIVNDEAFQKVQYYIKELGHLNVCSCLP
jgi:hypothetical protein